MALVNSGFIRAKEFLRKLSAVWARNLKNGRQSFSRPRNINPLNAELNPICHLLALLGAHHILHVSRVRVKKCLFEGASNYWPARGAHIISGRSLLYFFSYL
jgi:hypothetical protein